MHSIETSRCSSKPSKHRGTSDASHACGPSHVVIDECHGCKCPSCQGQAQTHFVARFEGGTLNTYSSTSCGLCGYWDGHDVYSGNKQEPQDDASFALSDAWSRNESSARQVHERALAGPARASSHPAYTDVTINGLALTQQQATVLRVAVHYFVGDLAAANLACDWHDREAMRDSLQRAAEIIDMMRG